MATTCTTRTAVRGIQVVPVIYKARNRDGDFSWMVQQPQWNDALFLFNDNIEHHQTNTAGGGNACMRPYNRHSNLPKPRSAGIPTGTLREGGFVEMTDQAKQSIDAAFEEVRDLIKTHKYQRVVYSAALRKDGKYELGTSIFQIGRSVTDYITKCIYDLENL
jgi:hypothetical protein